jgi:hypothetical protein
MNMATKIFDKSAKADQAKQLIAGTAKHLASTTQVMLEGGTFTPADVTNKLTQIVTLRSDVDTAKASTKAKLANEKTAMPALRTFMSAYVTYIKAAFGSAPDVLADFGLKPKKAPTPLTAEEKAAAAVKRAATRVARGTKGSKQKLAVTGDVVGITVTPVTAPAPSAPKAGPVNTTATPAASTPASPTASPPASPTAGPTVSPTATPAPHTAT